MLIDRIIVSGVHKQFEYADIVPFTLPPKDSSAFEFPLKCNLH